MDYRPLGASGLKVSALSFGAATFGGEGELFQAWGNSGVDEAKRLIDICLEAGVTLFDTADVYSKGRSEEILGKAIAGKRNRLLISTKATLRMGDGPNEVGSSRQHLLESVDNSLKRLGTDHIDLYHMHAFDAVTPIEETLQTLDTLVRGGKLRYIACSNFSGWNLMESLKISERHGRARYVAHQVYYSLIGRDYEWELMPLGVKHRVSALIWSPLGWGRLTGKIRRGASIPEVSRLHKTAHFGPQVSDEHLFNVVDALEKIAQETGKKIPDIALNWLLRRPTVASVIIGARNEEQLKQNLSTATWTLTKDQVSRLDKASAVPAPYPYWHQKQSAELNPPVIPNA